MNDVHGKIGGKISSGDAFTGISTPRTRCPSVIADHIGRFVPVHRLYWLGVDCTQMKCPFRNKSDEADFLHASSVLNHRPLD